MARCGSRQGWAQARPLGWANPTSTSKQTNLCPASPLCAPGGMAGKFPLSSGMNTLSWQYSGLGIILPWPNPASSYQYRRAIASWGTTPGLSRAHTLLRWLIIQIPFPVMKECITCSKGCRKYWVWEALGGSRKRPWIQAPALGLYPQSRPMLRA